MTEGATFYGEALAQSKCVINITKIVLKSQLCNGIVIW